MTVVQAHGKAHPETIKIANLWPGVQGELAMHMQKEELMLFPYIKRLVHTTAGESQAVAPRFGSAAAMIPKMEAEHEATGDGLAQIYPQAK